VTVVSIAAAVVSVVPLVLMAWLRVAQKREFGSFFADSRRYVRTVTLPVGLRDADGACHRALRAVLGHSESERRGVGRFECAGFEFELDEADGRTTITVAGRGSGDTWLKELYPSNVRAGHELVDRLADQIADTPLDGPLAEDHESYRSFDVI
jgi:hypothetical protein